MKKTKQPDYSKSKRKHNARKIMVDMYRHLTGTQTLPTGKQYWTLCNMQPDNRCSETGSEINQMLECGLINTKKQFHGIDNDENIINSNKDTHPDANWYHGDWKNIIKYQIGEKFNPAIVYFDTIYSVDNPEFVRDLSVTMNYSPPGTFVAANAVAEKLFAQKVFYDKVYKNLYQYVWDKEKWTPLGGEYFYRSNRLMMCTLFFVHRN